MLNKKLLGFSAVSYSPYRLLKGLLNDMKGGFKEEGIPADSVGKAPCTKQLQVYLEEKNMPGNFKKKIDIYVGS
jgi:hypothetical protein